MFSLQKVAPDSVASRSFSMRIHCRAFADRLLEEEWGRLWGLTEDYEGNREVDALPV
jgi:hypothetical protein